MGKTTKEEIDKATAELRAAIIERTCEMMIKAHDRIEKALSGHDSNEEIAAGHKPVVWIFDRAHRLQMEENERWFCGELEKLRQTRTG